MDHSRMTDATIIIAFLAMLCFFIGGFLLGRLDRDSK